MVIRPKPRVWSFWSPYPIATSLIVLLAAGRAWPADPMADSFASPKRAAPAHKATKKPAAKPASKPAAKPAARGKAGGHAPVRDEFQTEPAPAREEEEAPPPPPRREPPEDRPRPRRAEPADTAPDDQAGSGDDDDEKPKAKSKSRKKVADKKHKKKKGDEESEFGEGEEEEADDDEGASDAPFTSLPVVIPRLISFQAGGAVYGRSFAFTGGPALQSESSFPRAGFLVGLEAYPMIRMASGWWREIGVGGSFAREPIGQAAVKQPGGGTNSYSVSEGRWSFDLRYILPLGDRVVLIPSVGLLNSTFTLGRGMPINPSACVANQTMACIPNTAITLGTLGGEIRVALTSDLAASLDGAYMVGLAVQNKPIGQIGFEAATSVSGFRVEPGATYMLTDWLALRGTIPYLRYGYLFHNPPAAVGYRSATEAYYGLTVSALVFTK